MNHFYVEAIRYTQELVSQCLLHCLFELFSNPSELKGQKVIK